MKYHIVIGASRGIGAAIVRQLLGPDAVVFAVSRSPAEDLIAVAADEGVSLRWFTRDLNDLDGINTLFASIARMVREEPPTMISLIDVAAQLHPIGQVGSLKAEEVDRAVTVNLTAAIAATGQFVHHFGALPCPRRVILLSSGASRRVMPGLAVYSATKAGINAFAASVQGECDRAPEISDFRIVAVSPGLVDTDMQAILRNADPTDLPERDTYREWQRDGALSSPDDAARTILTLLERTDVQAGGYLHIQDL